MQFINNIKLKNKLILMLIAPVTGMLVFSFLLFKDANTDAGNSAAMSLLTDIAIHVNHSIDSLQDELDNATLYIREGGDKLASELLTHQKKTDEQIDLLNQVTMVVQDAGFNETFVDRLDHLNRDIRKISEIRAAINDNKMNQHESEDFYHRLIDDMLYLIEMLPRLTADKELANITSAYSNFLKLKNLAAQERHLLFDVFKQDKFEGRGFNEFNKLVHYQAVYEKAFLALARDEEKEYYKSTMTGEALSRVAEMREKVFNAVDYGAFNIEPQYWHDMQGEKLKLLSRVADKLTQDVKEKVEHKHSSAVKTEIVITVLSVLALVLTVFFAWMISAGIRTAVSSITHVMDRISVGDLTTSIAKTGKDEFGHLLVAIGKMQRDLKERIDSEAAISRANERVKQALDNVSACVMLADHKNEIIYINDAALSLFTNIEKDLASSIPGFKAREIVGSNIDKFHKNPSHQQTLVKNLARRHEAKFIAGGRSMSFVANPVTDDDGARLGTVVEWRDLTDEVNTEIEIQSIVEAVQQGDLVQRIDVRNKTGFFLKLSEGINALVEAVSSTLNDIDTTMSGLSNGDLTVHISNSYSGTFGSVASNVNKTIDQLSKIVGEISTASVEVLSTTREILDGNNSLSSRTEHQAAALEETASSMEEFTHSVKQNSDNAQMANTLSSTAREMADKGGQVVGDAINAMYEINASSEKIAEIIGVIDQIAFQTNLLALNASVEAARAGEQGRGFAVVATEVRNLAQRSATAAKEIKDLIQDSVHKVNAGSVLVNKSGETLKEIVQGIKKVGDIVSGIAAASQEQSTGIVQVNAAVASMDETTQQNAALAEQTSAASASLSDRAGDMSRQLQFFTLDTKTRHSPSGTTVNDKLVRAVQVAKPTPQSSGNKPGASKMPPKTIKPSPQTKKEPVKEVFNDEWEEF